MCDKKSAEGYEILIKRLLSKKRYTHSVNVANEAVKLAQRYGANPEKAYTAGLLHDICKEMTPIKQKELLLRSYDVCSIEAKSQPLWHAAAGAEYVRRHLCIEDAEIINAIRYHTSARLNMSVFEQVIYLADLISADRGYKDIKRMRQICYTDINSGMVEALKFIVNDQISKGNYLPIKTLEAYNFFIAAEKNK